MTTKIVSEEVGVGGVRQSPRRFREQRPLLVGLLLSFSLVYFGGNLLPALPAASGVDHFSIIDDPYDLQAVRNPVSAIGRDFLECGRVRPSFWLVRSLENVFLPRRSAWHHAERIALYLVPFLFLAYVGARRRSEGILLGILLTFMLIRARRLGVDVFGRLSPQEGYSFFFLLISLGILLLDRRSWAALALSILFLGAKEHCLLYAPFLVLCHQGRSRRIALGVYAVVMGLLVMAVKMSGETYGAMFGKPSLGPSGLLRFADMSLGWPLALAGVLASAILAFHIGGRLKDGATLDWRLMAGFILLLTSGPYVGSLVAWPYFFPRYVFLPVSTMGLSGLLILDYLWETWDRHGKWIRPTLLVAGLAAAVVQLALFPAHRPMRRFLVAEAQRNSRDAKVSQAFDAFFQERGVTGVICVTKDWEIFWEPAVNLSTGYNNAFRGRSYRCEHIKYRPEMRWDDEVYYVVGEEELRQFLTPLTKIGSWWIGVTRRSNEKGQAQQ
ncbi:MAG: hypothetical protein QME60_01570 [Verrucomicrobiota bacterium]|nr:hypothetical protein [Verrucomicrobiota bacterium]